MATQINDSFGDHLRTWRRQRRISQLDLALDADISARHLSFVETGRAKPSREMVLRLADTLDLPLRERNRLLVAAGFAPLFPERGLDDAALAGVRAAVDRLLAAHAPYPAIAIDQSWHLLAFNAPATLLMEDLPPELMTPPVNVLRASLHPQGLLPRIANAGEWRAHILHRLKRQSEATRDPALAALHAELAAFPAPPSGPEPDLSASDVIVPLELDTRHGRMSFIATTTLFGSPLDVTLSELAIESFFPADEATAALLQSLAAKRG
jgi:transcriptional regulator with XRE-family HTH domain